MSVGRSSATEEKKKEKKRRGRHLPPVQLLECGAENERHHERLEAEHKSDEVHLRLARAPFAGTVRSLCDA